MKTTLYLFLLLLISRNTQAQKIDNFKIVCDTSKFVFNAPSVKFFTDRIDENILDIKTLDPRPNVYPFEFNISLTKVNFIQLVNTPLIIYSGGEVTGSLSDIGQTFLIKNGNMANVLLSRYFAFLGKIGGSFGKESSFKDFVKLYDSLKHFVDFQIMDLNHDKSNEEYHLDVYIKSALKEFLSSSLASFSVSPSYYNNDYLRQIRQLVEKDIKINNLNYWFQIQLAKGFFANYFTRVTMPLYKHDLNKSLNSSTIFKDPKVKSYVTYKYFEKILNTDTSFKSSKINYDKITEFEKNNKVEGADLIAFEHLKERYRISGNSITNLIYKESLLTISGKPLDKSKYNLLFMRDKVMLYFWATWCHPCLETMKMIKSPYIKLDNDNYKIIFISIDSNPTKWMNFKSSALNAENSYRISNMNSSSFNSDFNIYGVPRIVLIENGILKDQNFSSEKLKDLIKRF